MSQPPIVVDVQPREGDKFLYLPLAPRAIGEPRRLKIGLRLEIKNIDSERTVEIKRIVLSFPGTRIPDKEMTEIPESMSPANGVIGPGQTAFWCNGRFTEHNEVFLDDPAPPQIKISIHSKIFLTFSKTMDLIPYEKPTGTRAVLIPFSVADLEDNEYVSTRGLHHARGGARGRQIFAHDFSVQARRSSDGEWSRLIDGVSEATQNSHHRIFRMPVRAIAGGEVFDIDDGHRDNPAGVQREGAEPNFVWIRHRNIEVYYSHLRKSSIVVKPGDTVVAGQKIGEVGSSGNSNGIPHLHMHGRDTDTDTLRGFAFRNATILDRDLVESVGAGPWPTLNGTGVCEQRSVIRPKPLHIGPFDVGPER